MRSTDKALIAIVGAIAVLVVGAFALALLKPEPTYLPEDAPDGVAFNYLLALQREHYGRALGYLSRDLPGYPATAARFEQQVRDAGYWFDRVGESSFAIASTEVRAELASVEVRETYFSDGGLFETSQHISVFDMQLERIGGEWKITDADRYFLFCWGRSEGCE